MSLDHKIDIQISLGAPSVSRAGFGVVLVLADGITISDRVKTYTPSDNYATDGDLDAETIAALTAIFSQPMSPNRAMVARADTTGGESLAEALDDARDKSSDWFGLVSTTRDAGDIEDIAAWAEANNRFYLAQSSDADILTTAGGDIAETLSDASYRMTALVYHDEDNDALDAGWLGGFLAKSFDLVAPTSVYQTVAGVAPSLDDVGEQIIVEGKNANYYSTLKGVPATFGGTVADGHAIEHVVTGAWVEARLSEKIAQLFLNATERGARIPYNDRGIAMFEQATYDVLKRGEDIGHFNPGSSEVKMPRRIDVPEGDVEDGILRYEWGAQYSGVIKAVEMVGYVSLAFSGFETED